MLNKYFDTQQDDEKVLFLTREHPITLVPTVIIAIFAYIMGFVIIFIAPNYISFLNEGVGQNAFHVIMSLYFLFSTLFFFIEWFSYHLHINLVTNERIVDVNQSTVFSRHIAEMEYAQIQDASAHKLGFFQTIFNYGNVEIQTAGATSNFVFEKVPDPYTVARKIMEVKEAIIEKKPIPDGIDEQIDNKNG